MGFPGGSAVKNLPAMEKQVQFLGWEDTLEKEMATHSIYSWLETSMDRRAWWAAVHGVSRVRHDLATTPPPCETHYTILSAVVYVCNSHNKMLTTKQKNT